MRNALLRTTHGLMRGGGGVNSIGDALTIAELSQVLESGLGHPVIDETHLTGRYAVNVLSEAVSAREFLSVLCDRLGLVVTSERRDVPMLVVRQR